MLGEWMAFEKEYGPLLIHERVDWGLATVVASMAGGTIKEHMPPWYSQADSEDAMVASLMGLAERYRKDE